MTRALCRISFQSCFVLLEHKSEVNCVSTPLDPLYPHRSQLEKVLVLVLLNRRGHCILLSVKAAVYPCCQETILAPRLMHSGKRQNNVRPGCSTWLQLKGAQPPMWATNNSNIRAPMDYPTRKNIFFALNIHNFSPCSLANNTCDDLDFQCWYSPWSDCMWTKLQFSWNPSLTTSFT